MRHAAFAAERPRVMHDRRTRLASDRPGGRRRRTQVRRAAREQIKAGADNVKLIASGGILTRGTNIGNPQFTVAEMRAAVEEAHPAGKTANAHAHGAEGIKRAAAAGVDSIEHCYFIDREGIDMMLARSTVLVATSAAVRNVVSYGVAAGIPPTYRREGRIRDQCPRVWIQGGP